MINLLPPQYQARLKAEEKWRLVLILETIFLISLFSLSLIFLSLSIYIKTEAESLKILVDTEKENFQKTDLGDIKEKSILLNKTLSKINLFYTKETDVGKILEDIFQRIPKGVYLDSFSWQKNSSVISISGFSQSRELLLQFKNNLKESKNIIKVEFPLSTWQKPEDIYFNVKLELKAVKKK